MSLAELQSVINSVGAIRGARLQEVFTSDAEVGLGFYSGGALAWLWIDLDAVRPSLLPWPNLPRRVRAVKTPLQLFLRAHFVGRALNRVSVDEARGRVVHLTFGGGDEYDPRLEVRLIPHVRNIIATAAEKSLAWQRPRDLEPEAPADPVGRAPRDLDGLRDQWLVWRGAPPTRAARATDPVERVKSERGKRARALVKVEDELARKRDQPWGRVGDWLKSHQSLDVPLEWAAFVDRRRKLSWNIETAYARARELTEKTAGTERRRRILIDEIARLDQELSKPADQITAPAAPSKNPLRQGDGAQGRTLRLSDEVTVIAGKHAADNMKLLRRARAWDLWIHLRDNPSSHAILFRNKNTKVSDADLLTVAAWFVSLQSKKKVASGERFEVLIAECRFVRPIKGDAIGRVTYRDERTLIYRAP